MAAHRRDAGCLGEPVAGHDGLELQLLAHAADQLDRDRRRAGDREAQRREIELGDARVVEDRLVDGRRPGQHRDRLLGDALHHRVDVEHRVRHDRRALDQAREDAGLQPERVEERVDDEIAVAGPEPDHGRPRVVRLHARAVREHRALGPAGRARGEEDVGERVAGERGAALVDARRPRLRRRERGSRTSRRFPSLGRPAQHDDLLERRRRARPTRRSST